jgi:alkaline phosphatase D
MLWLGDNIYLRDADWNSRSGILKRYSHTRALSELQPLLASAAHYAVWDDHDFGPNNSNRGWWGKDNALEANKLFWPNPSFGTFRMPGMISSFSMLDVQVFMLDDRYYRTPEKRIDGMGGGILGMEQLQWLIDALASSTATFKIVAVGSQFLSSDTTKENFTQQPRERQMILDMIERNKINGVMFVSGDIHASELSKLDRNGTYPLYEFTCSSLTAGSNTGIANQPNIYRVPGTAYGQHNFGLITVSGKRKERVLTLRCMDKEGKEVWKREIKESELR